MRIGIFIISILLCTGFAANSSPPETNARIKNYAINLIIFKHRNAMSNNEKSAMNLRVAPHHNTLILVPIKNQTNTIPHDAIAYFDAPKPYIMKHILNRIEQTDLLYAARWLFHAQPRQKFSQTWQIKPEHSVTESMLHGSLTLQLKRFFDVNLNLDLDDNHQHFKLSQVRRMRSNQLNYIDHPAFGAFLLVESIKHKNI